MSNIIADPLFVKAEVDYRLERYGAGPHHTREAWPNLSRRLRRWRTAHRAEGNRGHGVLVARHHPRHP